MPWAAEDDMLVGDVVTPSGTRDKFLDDAENEMLVHLTQYYATPLPDNASLPEHILRLLKQTHARLASGRMLLALATSSEDESLHAYGLSLLTDARSDLMRLGTQTPIPGASAADNNGGEVDNDRTPLVLNADTASPFAAFADYTSNAGFDPWEPYK